MTRNQIIKKIGNPNLNLYTGEGYFYFVYDTGNIKDYADHSVYSYRLNHMSLDQWVDEGNGFLKEGGSMNITLTIEKTDVKIYTVQCKIDMDDLIKFVDDNHGSYQEMEVDPTLDPESYGDLEVSWHQRGIL